MQGELAACVLDLGLDSPYLACRRWDATPKIIMLFGGVHLAMVAYGFQQPQLGQIIFSKWGWG